MTTDAQRTVYNKGYIDALEASLPATFAALPGPLGRWKATLANDAANAKIVFLGDSTSYDGAEPMYTYLRTYLNQSGMPLAGVADANIVQGGNNGWTLRSWLDDATGANSATYSGDDLIADDPDLIVAGWLTNDVRQGACDLATAIARLDELVAWRDANVPGADLLLRMPANFTTTVVGTDYVDGITHQAATDLLRAAYLKMTGRHPNVDVLDLMGEVFGTVATATSALKYDELHPSTEGYRLTAEHVARRAGFPRALAAHRGRTLYRGYVSSAGNGYIDIAALTGDRPTLNSREFPLTTGDTLVLSDYGGLALTSSTFGVVGNNLRILKTGDWTSLAGQVFEIDTTNPGPGAQEGRYFATIDPGSVAAGATLDVTTTISGITREMGVVCQPPSAIIATGLMWSASISADNTVTIRLYNPTGSAIDMASNSGWRFWILR